MDTTTQPAAGVMAPAVASALGGDGEALRLEELTHNAGNQATGGIWRVHGPAGRAVLKIAKAGADAEGPWATGERADHWNFWRREPLAYQSGLAHTAFGVAGLGAPRLLALVEPSPGVLALWLEDVAGLPGPRWPVERLAGAAARLGRAQAAWGRRDEIVLLDWAFTGAGAVGEDVANLIADSVADGLIDPALLPEIDQTCTSAYLGGLRAGGWSGGDAEVRHAIAVTGAAKYCWLAPLMLQRLADRGPSSYDRRTPAEILHGRAGMLTLIADWTRDALTA